MKASEYGRGAWPDKQWPQFFGGQMSIPVMPKTRQELFQAIADHIGWGASANDVASFVEEAEAAGVCFVPRCGTAMMVQILGLPGNENGLSKALAFPANPFAPPLESSNGN